MKNLCALTAVTLISFFFTPAGVAASPSWAKKATAFPAECDPAAKENKAGEESPRMALAPVTASCTWLRIPSPDGRSSVEVDYSRAGEFMRAFLRVRTPEGVLRKTSLPPGFQRIDLLWSPDSKAFFVNGGNGGGYWGFWVYAYLLSDQELRPINVTKRAQRNMVLSFPPCRASYLDKQECKAIEKDPHFNMTGIDWVPGASAIVVMAEIPCSGTYGGIMCQIQGYELEVPTGRILKKMSARRFASAWQKSMAWKFRVPDPPDYCTKSSDRTLPPCAGHN